MTKFYVLLRTSTAGRFDFTVSFGVLRRSSLFSSGLISPTERVVKNHDSKRFKEAKLRFHWRFSLPSPMSDRQIPNTNQNHWESGSTLETSGFSYLFNAHFDKLCKNKQIPNKNLLIRLFCSMILESGISATISRFCKGCAGLRPKLAFSSYFVSFLFPGNLAGGGDLT